MIMNEKRLFLNASEAAGYIGIGRRSFYYLKNSGGFPRPKKIFGKMDYYLQEDLEVWAKSLPYEDKNDNQ